MVDVVAATGCLAIAWWRTAATQPAPDIAVVIAVALAAAGYGACVGLWARSAKRPPVLVLALMLVIVVVFILLTGAPQDFSASRWAWLLTSFAGGIIGASAGERLAAARRSKATGKATSRRRP